MVVYDFLCNNPTCNRLFEERVPVGTRSCPCPECHEEAVKQFNPKSVAISSFIPNGTVTRWSTLHGFESTAEHSANYLYHKKDEENSRKIYESLAKRKPMKTLEERMREKMPNLRLDEPLTRAESQEIQRLLAQGPPKKDNG